jgi:hypothetical protein
MRYIWNILYVKRQKPEQEKAGLIYKCDMSYLQVIKKIAFCMMSKLNITDY